MSLINVGDSQTFTYTGTIQTLEIVKKGLYKLEVWGAQGGNSYNCSGGAGGYSIGYIVLSSGQTLYIGAGGAGNYGAPVRSDGSSTFGTLLSGGYNGGGTSYYMTADYSANRSGGGSGGGATHIALMDGTLPNIGETNWATQGLIIAGGGGGAGSYYYPNESEWSYYNGVSGGGTGGNNGFGTGGSGANGVTNSRNNAGGGGGYSGGSSYGYGGSGHIGNVPEITFKGTTYTPSTTNGVNSGNGYATITLVDKKVINKEYIIGV